MSASQVPVAQPVMKPAVKRHRLLWSVVAFAILLLVVAAIGATAAPAHAKTHAAPAPPAPPTPAPAPATPAEPSAEPSHTTLDFHQGSADSLASDDDDASTSNSMYWTKSHGGNGDLVRFGEDVTVPVGRTVLGDVVAMGGDINVFGNVTGDAVALGGNVHVQPGGGVRGDAVSIGGRVINDTGRALHGPSVSLPSVPPWLFNFEVVNLIGQWIAVVKILFTLLLFAAGAWAANALAPERSERAVAYVRARPGVAFLWGLGTFIGIAPSAVAVALFSALLCITLIGIPVAILLLAAYVVALILLVLWGSLIGSAIVGRWVWHRLRPLEPEPHLLKAMLVGIGMLAVPNVGGHLLRSLGTMVPVASGLGIAIWVMGCLMSLVFWILGIGALIATRAGMPPRLVPAVPGAVPPMPPVAPAMPAAPVAPAPPMAPAPPSAAESAPPPYTA